MTDFSKAFDVIDHNIAVTKLLSMGVSPSIVQWVADFISGRKQRVKYKNSLSEWQTLLGGVPQGTILAPIIFLSIINSAQESDRNSNIHVWKYVDDLTIGESRSYGKPSKIQNSMDSLHQWTIDYNMTLNPTKCQVMQVYFGKKSPPNVDISISSQKLAVVEKVKLLGVIIDKDLKWEGQVNSMYSKANRKLFMLRKLKEAGLDKEDLLLVYKGYVRPCLEYAAPLWHAGLTQQQANHLEKIQKRVCRCILSFDYTTYTEALVTLDIQSLQDRRIQLCKEFAIKASSSVKFSRWFPCSDFSSRMQLRKRAHFKPYRFKTNRFKNSTLPYLTSLLNN